MVVEVKRTSEYTIGPTAVTNMARPKLARRDKIIFACIHTGMEIIVQIITSDVMTIIIKARSIIDLYVS
jgi:hypothetical protein